MPELTHDTAEDGFHEIQLSGKQLVFLFMATTVASVVIFLCGVLVGRGVAAEAGSDTSIAAPIEGESPAPVAGVDGAEPEAPVVDEFDYHPRLQKPGGAKETLKPAAKPEPEPAAAPPVTAAAPPVQEAKPAPPERATPDVPTSGRPGTWFLQVSALSTRAAAAEMVRTLIAKGYPAYLQEPGRGEAVIYRVRIGRYGDRSEAEKIAARLKKEDQFGSQIRRN